MVFKEKWNVYGVQQVSFVNDDGDSVSGLRVFYTREPYDEQEAEYWKFGGVSPVKPFWVSGELALKFQSLITHTDLSKDCSHFKIFAVYSPQGRFNRVTDFERYEEIDSNIFDDMPVDGDA